MLKSRPDKSETLIKNNRRSTFANHLLQIYCESGIFIDEITDESSEFQNNATTLTSQFKILQNETDGNCLFHP